MCNNLRTETDQWVKELRSVFEATRSELKETLEKRTAAMKQMFDHQMSKVLVEYEDAIEKVSYQSKNLETLFKTKV